MHDPNIDILEVVVETLKELADSFVFIGGATVGIYVTDSAVPKMRPTEDIDCVVEVTNLNAYYEVTRRLGELGFKPDPTESVICRFKNGPLILDVMPTEASILSFSNPWYPEGVRTAETFRLPRGRDILIFKLPYFLASKIQAFIGRGQNDFRASTDFEDIITLFDGNSKIGEICKASDRPVLAFVRSFLDELSKHPDFVSIVEGHMNDHLNASGRARIVIERMRSIISN